MLAAAKRKLSLRKTSFSRISSRILFERSRNPFDVIGLIPVSYTHLRKADAEIRQNDSISNGESDPRYVETEPQAVTFQEISADFISGYTFGYGKAIIRKAACYKEG